MIRGLRHDDDGFSAAELLVASFVGLLALGAAYLLYETGMTGFRNVENTTIANRNAAEAMSMLDRPIRELQQISIAKDYEIQFLADTNDDDALERMRLYLPDGSTTLMMDRASSSGVGTVTSTIADKIRNRGEGLPLFTYYSVLGGAPMSNETSRAAYTKLVRLAVVTWADSTPTPVPYRVQTDILLRNRMSQ